MTDQIPASAMLDVARIRSMPALRFLLALQVIRTLFRLGFLGATAIVVGHLVMQGQTSVLSIVAAIALLFLTSATSYLADRWQMDAETNLAIVLRDEVGRRLDRMPTRALQALPVGHLVVSMQRHPDALAALAISHRAATMMMATGPLLAAGALALVSWPAALLMLVLTPLMFVFFILVGDTIRRRADAQEKAFGRLAGQFADRMRALPTILANHTLAPEESKLADRLNAYATNTMSVLRVAFLNAAIIDFFASLSIAMLAVFLGLGHLGLASIPGFSGLELWQSLFILMIAPDYFAPFRRYAEQYHVKAEGQAAAAALGDILTPQKVVQPGTRLLPEGLPQRGLVAIVGPSGSGKTTMLRALAGVDGSEPRLPEITWVATDSFVPAGTLAEAIVWGSDAVDEHELEQVAERLNLTDGHLLGELEADIAVGGANLSGGQRLRLSVARALVAGKAIVADEPTAKLDPTSAERVRSALRLAAHDHLVVVATHDPLLAQLADEKIDLSERAAA